MTSVLTQNKLQLIKNDDGSLNIKHGAENIILESDTNTETYTAVGMKHFGQVGAGKFRLIWKDSEDNYYFNQYHRNGKVHKSMKKMGPKVLARQAELFGKRLFASIFNQTGNAYNYSSFRNIYSDVEMNNVAGTVRFQGASMAARNGAGYGTMDEKCTVVFGDYASADTWKNGSDKNFVVGECFYYKADSDTVTSGASQKAAGKFTVYQTGGTVSGDVINFDYDNEGTKEWNTNNIKKARKVSIGDTTFYYRTTEKHAGFKTFFTSQ